MTCVVRSRTKHLIINIYTVPSFKRNTVFRIIPKKIMGVYCCSLTAIYFENYILVYFVGVRS